MIGYFLFARKIFVSSLTLSEQAYGGYCSEQESADEIDPDIHLYPAALQAADSPRYFVGDCCEAVHGAVDDMAVKPCYGAADTGEYNLVGDKLIEFVPIEAVETPAPEWATGYCPPTTAATYRSSPRSSHGLSPDWQRCSTAALSTNTSRGCPQPLP